MSCRFKVNISFFCQKRKEINVCGTIYMCFLFEEDFFGSLKIHFERTVPLASLCRIGMFSTPALCPLLFSFLPSSSNLGVIYRRRISPADCIKEKQLSACLPWPLSLPRSERDLSPLLLLLRPSVFFFFLRLSSRASIRLAVCLHLIGGPLDGPSASLSLFQCVYLSFLRVHSPP